jgi:Fe-S-cluster containining protein
MDAKLDFARETEAAAIVPKDLMNREDHLPEALRDFNASPRSKLRRIYAVMEEISQARSEFVACGKGCADCCRINIGITSLEAVQIAAATGRQLAPVGRSTSHPTEEFYGKACPFLADNVCTIYEDRPLACRKHASYYVTNSACSAENKGNKDFPLLSYSGLDTALFMVSGARAQPVMADIRDFFPS